MEDSSLDIHPAGRWGAVIEDYGLSESCVGAVFFRVRMRTVHGALRISIPFAASGAEQAAKQVWKLGFRCADLAELNTDRSLVGRRCTVLISHEVWGDKIRAVFKDVVTSDDAQVEKSAAAAAAVRRFNHLLPGGRDSVETATGATAPGTTQGSAAAAGSGNAGRAVVRTNPPMPGKPADSQGPERGNP